MGVNERVAGGYHLPQTETPAPLFLPTLSVVEHGDPGNELCAAGDQEAFAGTPVERPRVTSLVKSRLWCELCVSSSFPYARIDVFSFLARTVLLFRCCRLLEILPGAVVRVASEYLKGRHGAEQVPRGRDINRPHCALRSALLQWSAIRRPFQRYCYDSPEVADRGSRSEHPTAFAGRILHRGSDSFNPLRRTEALRYLGFCLRFIVGIHGDQMVAEEELLLEHPAQGFLGGDVVARGCAGPQVGDLTGVSCERLSRRLACCDFYFRLFIVSPRGFRRDNARAPLIGS